MPHSSGGGSHGGGSHGGGSHGGHGGGSVGRVSNTHFAGARRFVTYSNHTPHYMYANYDITGKVSKLRYLLLIFYIPFFAVIIGMFFSAIQLPSKLRHDYGPAVIEDNIGVIDNKDELYEVLNEFKETTGIPPYVITVYNEDWFDNYYTLEKYAYDLYVNKIDDESHWLIVYSQPKEPDEYFVDWHWEGMQGDDTDRILSKNKTERFTKGMQAKLTANTKYTVGEAITENFRESLGYIGKFSADMEQVFMGIFMLAFVSVHCYFLVFYRGKDADKYKDYVECPKESVEVVCDYCNGVYVKGTVLNCPHCGAPVKLDNTAASV